VLKIDSVEHSLGGSNESHSRGLTLGTYSWIIAQAVPGLRMGLHNAISSFVAIHQNPA
jgi:hypothetical protein